MIVLPLLGTYQRLQHVLTSSLTIVSLLCLSYIYGLISFYVQFIIRYIYCKTSLVYDNVSFVLTHICIVFHSKNSCLNVCTAQIVMEISFVAQVPECIWNTVTVTTLWIHSESDSWSKHSYFSHIYFAHILQLSYTAYIFLRVNRHFQAIWCLFSLWPWPCDPEHFCWELGVSQPIFFSNKARTVNRCLTQAKFKDGTVFLRFSFLPLFLRFSLGFPLSTVFPIFLRFFPIFLRFLFSLQFPFCLCKVDLRFWPDCKWIFFVQ